MKLKKKTIILLAGSLSETPHSPWLTLRQVFKGTMNLKQRMRYTELGKMANKQIYKRKTDIR